MARASSLTIEIVSRVLLRAAKAIDLFCGVGGFSLGFQRAGFDVCAAFDNDEINVKTYNKNFPGSHAFQANLEKAAAGHLLDLANIRSDKIDVVFGGPPCQGFSMAGRRDSKDERNALLFSFARLVGELNPQYFVLENVDGLTMTYGKSYLETFLEKVEALGYDVVRPLKVLDAFDFGVPQRRRRVFILGYRKGLSAPVYPEATGKQVTVWEAISDLPEIDDFDELLASDVYRGELGLEPSEYAKALRLAAEALSTAGLSGCGRVLHRENVRDRFMATVPGEVEEISRFFRLAKDKPSRALRAGTKRDRGSHTAPRPIHPVAPRCISAREAARLHSFPDAFQFHPAKWHGFRQIGNSVPPLLAQAVAESLMRAFQRNQILAPHKSTTATT